MKNYEIHTDGACSGNPGPGGFAAIVVGDQAEKLVVGAAAQTTNNRMELQAAVAGLQSLTAAAKIDLYTDSVYLQKGMNEWLKRWRNNGWRTAGGAAVKNQDLWQLLYDLTQIHQIQWHWVKGHSDNLMNERADLLARQALAEGLSLA